MSMSTLLRSGLVKKIVLAGFSLFVTWPIVVVCAEATKMLTFEEAQAVKEKIAQAMKLRDDFPEEPVKSITLMEFVRWSADSNGKFLAPVVIRFAGVSNSYCRLVTFDSEKSPAIFVEIPVQSNFDNCRKFHSVHYLDVNADGVLDFVASSAVKSNAFDGYVDEQVVYLSDAHSKGGYCFSESASASLQPKYMLSRAAIVRALAQEKARLNISQFSCATEP